MTPERVGEGGMTMSTATIFDLLETDADAPDSVKRIVRMMNHRQGAILVGVQCVSVWFRLGTVIRSQRELRRTMSRLSDLPLENDDRLDEMLRERAKGIGRLAAGWGEIDDMWCSEIAPKLSAFSVPFGARIGPAIAHRLEEIVCGYEDVAETLALAASEPFAQLVATELATIQSECGRQPDVG